MKKLLSSFGEIGNLFRLSLFGHRGESDRPGEKRSHKHQTGHAELTGEKKK